MSDMDFTARGLLRRLDADLGSNAVGKGAALVGAEGGGTVQDALNGLDGFAARAMLASNESGDGLDLIGEPTVEQMLASTAPARGEGSRWHAGGYRYTEAASSATDHHLATAGGVKLYVDPVVPMLAYPARAFGASPGASAPTNNTAIQAAMDAAAERNWDVMFEAGVYAYSAEFTATKPIGIIGRGWTSTIFEPDAAYSGWFMGFTEVNIVANDTLTPPSYSLDTSGVRLKDFSIRCPGRSATQQQHGIRFIGRCDRIVMDNVYFAHLVGTALHLGHMKDGDPGVTAYVREVMISNVEARYCGDDANLRPVVVIDSYGSGGFNDASNLCVFNRFWVVYPFSAGIKIVNNNTTTVPTIRRLVFNNTLVHGIQAIAPSPAVTSEPLIHIVGKVWQCIFNNLWFNSHYTGQYGVQIEDNATGVPSVISFAGGGISTGLGHGFNFADGFGYMVDFHAWSQTGTGVTVGAGVTGAVTIKVSSGIFPTLSIASGLEKLVNADWSNSANLPIRSEKFLLGPNGTAPGLYYYAGNPEGNVTANQGAICLNTAVANAANNTTVYIKRSGAGNTGWKQMAEVLTFTTAARPATVSVGVMGYDTTLNKPVWCKVAGTGAGGAWVDATGATV